MSYTMKVSYTKYGKIVFTILILWYSSKRTLRILLLKL